MKTNHQHLPMVVMDVQVVVAVRVPEDVREDAREAVMIIVLQLVGIAVINI